MIRLHFCIKCSCDIFRIIVSATLQDPQKIVKLKSRKMSLLGVNLATHLFCTNVVLLFLICDTGENFGDPDNARSWIYCIKFCYHLWSLVLWVCMIGQRFASCYISPSLITWLICSLHMIVCWVVVTKSKNCNKGPLFWIFLMDIMIMWWVLYMQT